MANEGDVDTKPSLFRAAYALGIVSFFTDISSHMVLSLLPLFIVELPGSGTAILGLIEGLAEFLSYYMRAVSGVFSDKFRKRKLLVLIGYGISNIVKPLFAISQTAVDVLIIRVADRVGKGVRTSPRDALLSESVPEKRRGAAFGIHRTLDQSGAILGPLIASCAMVFLGLTIRDIFWISYIPGLLALVALFFFVQEHAGKVKRDYKILEGMTEVLKGPFVLLLLIVGIFHLGTFTDAFILINAKEAGLGVALVPLFTVLMQTAHTVIAIPSGMLSDKIGKEKVLVLGYTAFLATGFLIFLWPGNLLFAVLIAVIFGVYEGITNTVARALVPKYSASALRGTAYGIYYLVIGSSALIANIAVGTLWETSGISTAVIYSMTISILAIIVMLLFIHRYREEASS